MISKPPLSVLPAQPTWYVYLFADRSRMLRAISALGIGIAAAWSLGAADFGVLQSALALAMILAAVSGLGLDPLVREKLKLHPLETTSTLGTGMALRCAAGIMVYFMMVMATSPTEPTRPVWLVAALLVLTQTPLLIGLRFEDPIHRPRALFAENLALILSLLVVVMLVWVGAEPVWFAAAVVLEQPLAGLLLLLGHDSVAPEEETFHWEGPAAIEWLKTCWKPLGAVLLTLALLPVSQLLVICLNTPREAGYFGIAVVLFEFGAFCASVIILGRLAHSRTTPDEAPISTDSAVDDFTQAASVGWILALAVASISALLAFTVFKTAALRITFTGALLGASLVPLALGLVRDEYWRRAGCADRTVTARLIAVIVNLGLAFWIAPQAGAVGVAGCTLVTLIIGEIVMTSFPGHAPRLAHAQAPALILLGRQRGKKARIPAPLAAIANSSLEPEISTFVLLPPTSLTTDHDSPDIISPVGTGVKNP